MKYLHRLFVFGILIFFLAATAQAEVITIDGTIKSVDAAKRTITVETEGEEKTLDVSSKAKISVEGKDANLDSLKPSQKVKLSYHDELEIVLKIEVGKTTTVKDSIRTAELVQVTELPDGWHSLAPDGLTIYFQGPDKQIWTAHRKTAEELFTDAKSTHITGSQPNVSSNGLEMIYVTTRNDGKLINGKGSESLHTATRSSVNEPFRRPSEIAELLDESAETVKKGAYLSHDGLTLYLVSFSTVSNKTIGTLVFSTRALPQERWSQPQPLPITKTNDSWLLFPFVSADGCSMLAYEGGGGGCKNHD